MKPMQPPLKHSDIRSRVEALEEQLQQMADPGDGLDRIAEAEQRAIEEERSAELEAIATKAEAMHGSIGIDPMQLLALLLELVRWIKGPKA